MKRKNSRSLAVPAASATLVLVLAFAGRASAQDLLERAASGDKTKVVSAESYANRDRLDLVAGARIPTLVESDSGSARLGLSGTIESDFACGRFDLRAQLKSLLTKEAGEEFIQSLLGAVEGELSYNALMLLAEASPTAFQIFQSWRVNANALLGLHYNRCQAIESAISDGMKGIRARALKACIDEKRQGGASMEQAMKECESEGEIRDLSGNRVKEIDLTAELTKALKLGDVDTKNLEKLLSKVRITKGGATGEIKAEPVLEEYTRLEKEYYAAWLATTSRLAAGADARVTDDEMAKLGPSWAPRPLPSELSEIAHVPEGKRRILLEGIARQAALLDLTVKVQKLERWLAAAAQHPELDEATVRRREQEIRDLRRQMGHLAELVKRQEEYNAALLGLNGTAQREEGRRASENLYRAKSREASREALDLAPGWGDLSLSSPKKSSNGSGSDSSSSSSSLEGRGCSNCGFGTLKGK